MKKEDRRIQKTKAAISAALFDLLEEKDFDQISINDIADRANVNRGTIYFHYADKFDLLDKIIEDRLEDLRAVCSPIHWDSTEKDKGAFYMSVPNVASYRSMEPVASNWQKHNALGESLVAGLKNAGVKIFSSGAMEMDLTQTSFSTIPSIDIELGDKKSDHSDAVLNQLADGLLDGINRYFMS